MTSEAISARHVVCTLGKGQDTESVPSGAWILMWVLTVPFHFSSVANVLIAAANNARRRAKGGTAPSVHEEPHRPPRDLEANLHPFPPHSLVTKPYSHYLL